MAKEKRNYDLKDLKLSEKDKKDLDRIFEHLETIHSKKSTFTEKDLKDCDRIMKKVEKHFDQPVYNDLLDELLKDEEEKPYRCPVCKKTYKDKYEGAMCLMKHKKKVKK